MFTHLGHLLKILSIDVSEYPAQRRENRPYEFHPLTTERDVLLLVLRQCLVELVY
jgi:hypothetical protein